VATSDCLDILFPPENQSGEGVGASTLST
jgi:hypothetical protein